MKPETPPVGVPIVVGIIVDRGRVLIARRPAATHRGGLWEFPGGKQATGESAAAGVVREIREELGIEAAVERKLAESTYAYPDRTLRLQFFQCRVVAGQPRALGCDEWRWVTLAEIDQYVFPEANADMLAELTRGRLRAVIALPAGSRADGSEV